MKTRLCVLFFALAMLFFCASVFAQTTRLLTPSPDSPTAMKRCGADLEEVSNRLGAHRRYIFTGSETLVGMRYCVREATTSVVDERNTYRVPSGTIGRLTDDGKTVVLQGCANDATCIGCPPLPPPAPVVKEPSLPPPVPIIVEEPPKVRSMPPVEHTCPTCGAVEFSGVSDLNNVLLTKDLNFSLTASFVGGKVEDVEWSFNGQFLQKGATLFLTSEDFTGSGTYRFDVSGLDVEGHIIVCHSTLTIVAPEKGKFKKSNLVPCLGLKNKGRWWTYPLKAAYCGAAIYGGYRGISALLDKEEPKGTKTPTIVIGDPDLKPGGGPSGP